MALVRSRRLWLLSFFLSPVCGLPPKWKHRLQLPLPVLSPSEIRQDLRTLKRTSNAELGSTRLSHILEPDGIPIGIHWKSHNKLHRSRLRAFTRSRNVPILPVVQLVILFIQSKECLGIEVVWIRGEGFGHCFWFLGIPEG